MHGHRDVSRLAAHISSHFGRNLRVAKSIRLIQVGDALLVPAPEGLAITPVTENQEPGGLHEHPLPDGSRVEIMIAGDGHPHQLVAHAARNGVFHGLLVVVNRLNLEVDADVVVALALKIFLQIALAGFEQIVVHGAFLKHGNVSLQHAARDLGFHRRHLHHRARRQYPGRDARAGGLRRNPAFSDLRAPSDGPCRHICLRRLARRRGCANW